MRFLIDTCVVSEWKRRRPDPRVLAWLDELTDRDAYFSVITVGELTKGVLRLPDGRRKTELRAWLDEFRDTYEQQILPLSVREVEAWGEISAKTEREGRAVAALDGLIAGTAAAHGLVVATRNVADFVPTGISVFDPWTGTSYNPKR